MPPKSTLTKVSLNKLILDIRNPRFAELYSGSTKEKDLINYLLYTEAAEDVAKGIVAAGEFYPDKPLWVIKEGDSYLVKDGNRRCAAVKALQFPDKYGLDEPKTSFKELPVLLYENKSDLDARILQEHTNSLFREWDRIAKALEAYKMLKSGNTLESMKEIDSQPAQLIKLASFYYEAVKIGGEGLKKLLRRGRGKTGGKTIIFERLFKFSIQCGYAFKNKPSYEIKINDEELFKSYITAMVLYLKANPDTNTQTIDTLQEKFLEYLAAYGFPSKTGKHDSFEEEDKSQSKEENIEAKHDSIPASTTATPNSVPSDTTSTTATPNTSTGRNTGTSGSKGSTKTKPDYKRKKLPSPLTKLIKECYSLDHIVYSNAKTALARVTFECTLKYIIENTTYKGKKNFSDSAYLRNVFFDGRGNKLPYTNFSKLKELFEELILNTGIKKAFENFDLERMHQIIHNYHVGAVPADATSICANLIPLIEFMLQKEDDLLTSLDLTKL